MSRLALWLPLLGLALLVPGRSLEARPRSGGVGTLDLQSTTTGAMVSIDGQERGLVPLPEPIKLPAGKHTLKLNKLGYTEYVDVFTIKSGQVTTLQVDLLPFAGVLVVTATVDGARVFVDGKFEGLTPLEKEALIGQRTVRVSKAGYYDVIATVKSVAGKRKRIHARLKPLPIGSTPYRPRPLPPPRWYERWYVWAGAAGGLVAVTLAVVLPVTLSGGDAVADWGAEKRAFIGKSQ